MGNIIKVRMVTRYGRSRGFGFVTYATENEAKKAVEELNQKALDGRDINVQIARPKAKLPSKEPTDQSQKKLRHHHRHRKPKKSASPPLTKSLDTKQPQKKKKPVPENRASRIPSKTTLFVANLPYTTTDDDLVKVFGNYKLVSAHVAHTRNGYSKGYGFVELENEQEQHKAYESLKDVVLDGRTIYLKIAMSAEEESKDSKKDTK
ncbi:uncharacterized protein B0P05DRAFT_553447 [Gilbertella persicaria]|uniref:uncharacterized protein n=1 Tax=Gilbertella persicaria TaxID=101096 RepID=UPI00221EE96F|nr:uncharacterized protein B0P05DRAFT_553447 [Gilbertella persicaria]KAI8066222.1 hypothetical protein B0P05DRAFT_553447 [Gilbertella persicaria]